MSGAAPPFRGGALPLTSVLGRPRERLCGLLERAERDGSKETPHELLTTLKLPASDSRSLGVVNAIRAEVG